jgi:hypothetical protein
VIATSIWATKSVGDTELAAAVTPAVVEAVGEVRARFGEDRVAAWPDNSRGAWVVIDGVDIGDFWTPTTSWLGFLISYLHPDSDCYPHFIGSDVKRADGQPLEAPFNPGNNFGGVPATLISRSSPRRRKDVETPADKAAKVIEFLRKPT